jgi:Gpi18-like mannosyltransferase
MIKRIVQALQQHDLLTAFVATRLALIAIALIALAIVPSVTGPEYQHASQQPLIDLWYRWDAGFFTRIARLGYGWMQGQSTGEVTFMPLYPLLVGLPLRFASAPDNAAAVIAGVSVSNLCLLLALGLFDHLLRLDNLPRRQRRWVIWCVLLNPATIFFSGVYTESLFFVLSLAAIYNARRERWIIAGLAGFLAAGTRVMGWTVAIALIVEAWQQRDRWRTPIGRWALAALALTPLIALPLYAGVVGLALHSPTAYFDITRQVWGQGLAAPWQSLVDFFNGPIALYGWQRSWIDLGFAVVGLLLVVPAYRLRRSYGLYQLAAIVFPIISGTLISMPRYTLIAFPIYAVLANWSVGHRRYAIGLLILSALLAAFFAARFVTWHWIA